MVVVVGRNVLQHVCNKEGELSGRGSVRGTCPRNISRENVLIPRNSQPFVTLYYALMLSFCLFACLFVAKMRTKTWFSQKLSSSLELWSVLTSFSWAFQRTYYCTHKIQDGGHPPSWKWSNRHISTNKNLSCCRETGRRFVSVNILLSHPRSHKVIGNNTVE